MENRHKRAISGYKGGEVSSSKNKSMKKVKHKRTVSLFFATENCRKTSEFQKALKKHVKESTEARLFFNSPIPDFLANNQQTL